MSPRGKPTLPQLIKKYNIHLDTTPIELPFTRPKQWPVGRGSVVEDILALGETRYDEYKVSFDYDTFHRPWRGQLRCRAERVAAIAQECMSERKNETEWRARLEEIVMARLSTEVACRKCRGRLWRSEKEVDPGHVTAEDAARRLRQRQQEREPCVCNPNEPRDDVGTNPVFGYCLGEGIPYPSELKRTGIPDRVYGLRTTSELEDVLFSEDIRETIITHPFRDDPPPVHFPFLVLEAKSEKGSGSLSGALHQSAFSIRELLEIQEHLRLEAGEGADWEAGPLVWFISNKGEAWKVYIAYIEMKDGHRHFRVVEVWWGAINRHRDALRLLLIVDYILDWARDMYWEGMIRALRKVATLDPRSRSLPHQDIDRLSTGTRAASWAEGDRHEIDIEEKETGAGVKDAYRALDTNQGVIRDIRYTQTRFVGLHITQDTLGAFLKSRSSEQQSKKLALSLLEHLLNAWRVKGRTLTALESDWTGKDRGLEGRDQEATFLVVATVAAYLSKDWEQTRELSYIAVEEGAFGRLLKYANKPLDDGCALSDLPFVEKEAFSNVLLRLRRQPAGSNLLSCISRVCLSTGTLSPEEDAHKEALSVASREILGQEEILRADTVFQPDNAATRHLVRSVYTEHKIGRNEPTCAFLRVSSVLDKLKLSPNAPPLSRSQIQRSPWFGQPPDIPKTPKHGVLVATSSSPISWPSAARLCLFVTDPDALRASDSPFQKLVRSEPRWTFRVTTYCDNEHDGFDKWNRGLERQVQHAAEDQPILPRVKAFETALDTLLARSAPGQADPDADDKADAVDDKWSPKRPSAKCYVIRVIPHRGHGSSHLHPARRRQ
ncbi:hypothetical protein C8A05DRAFT_18929 [Staphylotrichum tortipilum]|uniref:Uncharacterized protein n=1 Tax=Staphylotrichum tortipilum TaxID=2831512 RepID=A0AAN6MDK2_9PEZI|nr:hypothetical protein C8A05DRAFT_18929 [Staphylotrichum longicolle]